MDIFKKIDQLKKEIDALRPISADLEAKIMQKMRLDWNYNSNAIEGNRLTFGETKTFLLHDMTADGKSLKDHLDIKGHNSALLLLDDIIKEDRPIRESFIRELHQMILQENYYNKAVTPTGEETKTLVKVGEYKQKPNHVKTKTGEEVSFASPEETPAEMDQLIQWLRSETEKRKEEALHPVAIAALFHYKFIKIHPFDDGNGRLARILMNILLMRAGYPPTIIKVAKKNAYYIALRKADNKKLDAFVEYIGTVLLDSLELYLKGAKGESIEELGDFDKKLALFKRGLNGKKEKVTRNKEVVSEVYKKFISEFIDNLELLTLKLKDLFYDDNTSLDKYEVAVDVYNQQSINFYFNLYQFKQKPSKNIKIKVDVYFNLDSYQIDISLNSSTSIINITRDYDEIPKEEEWKPIVNKLGDEILKELKKALE